MNNQRFASVKATPMWGSTSFPYRYKKCTVTHMPSSNSPSKARKGGTTTLRDSRNGKFVDAPKKTQVEVVYRTYPSAAGPKNLTPQQIKKALAAA